MDDILAGFAEAGEVGALLGGLAPRPASAGGATAKRDGSRTVAGLLARVNWRNAADFAAPADTPPPAAEAGARTVGRPGSWLVGDLLGRVNWRNVEGFEVEPVVMAELDDETGGPDTKSELEVGGFFEDFQW